MKPYHPQEFKVVSLRECPLPEAMRECVTSEHAVAYWRLHVVTHPRFNPECECLVVLFLNTKRRIKGHHVVSIGTLDMVLLHPREVFRTAVVSSASAIVVMHNHPSGDPTPSQEDLRATRELVKAGQLMQINMLDHVIVGHSSHVSLRESGLC